jgi:hypothetical protein
VEGEGCPDEEADDLLRKLRTAKRQCSGGAIIWEERVKLHNQVVPEISGLDRFTKGKGSNRRPNDCRSKIGRLGRPQ